MEIPQQKYKVRSGTIDFGKEYEYKMVALISLQCILHGAEEFWIASNADDVGAFDDIIIQVKPRGSDSVTFMMQLKHKKTPKNIIEQEFLASKGDFSLTKYFLDISNLKKTMNKNLKTNGIINDLGSFDDIHFVLFTNRGSNHCSILEKDPKNKSSLLNSTNADDTVFKIEFSKLPDILKGFGSDISKNISLVCSQISAKHLDEQISKKIQTMVNSMRLKQINVKHIAKELTSFVTEWAKGRLGGHYYLTKQDIVSKLSRLLLCHYEVDLRKLAFIPSDCDQKKIWSEIISDKLITIVDINDLVLPFMAHYLSIEVHRFCKQTTLEDQPGEEHQDLFWTDILTDQESTFFYQNHDRLKLSMLKVIGGHGNITLVDMYRCLWINKELPLLVEINEANDYDNVLNILEKTNYHYKIIILNKTNAVLERANTTNCFYTMQDLDPDKADKILKQPVKLQGRASNALGNFIDETMYEYIKTTDIVDILSHNFNIGNEPNPLPQYFVERSIRRRFVQPKMLEQNIDEIFLLQNFHPEYITDLQIQQHDVYRQSQIDFNNPDKYKLIVIFEHDNTQLIDQLKSLGKSIHILYFVSQDLLEWNWSFGSTDKIAPYSFYKDVFESDLVKDHSNSVTLISAAPGMGKSTLMDCISHRAPSSKWVLSIDLKGHQKHFKYENCKSSIASKHLEYFNNKIPSNDSKLVRGVFHKFLSAKNVIVLLDGFDEISVSYKEQVTDIAKCFQKEGYIIWITTRPVMKSHLQETFTIFAVTLTPFTKHDQRLFLTNYFMEANTDLISNCDEMLLEFVEILLDAAKKNLHAKDAEFTGIPLQTKLLAEVFNDEFRKCLRNKTTHTFNTSFDLLYLYQKFIEKTRDICCAKYGAVEEYMIKFEKHQSLFSLQLAFPVEDLVEVDFMEQINYYYKENSTEFELLQRNGIIMIDEKFDVTFTHRTFAEYLAAKWLVDNIQNAIAQTLIKQRFTQNNKFLFSVFDRLLSIDCPLHLAIINEHAKQAERIMASDRNSMVTVDTAGRNVLHMIALYGRQLGVHSDNTLLLLNDGMLKLVDYVPHDMLVIKNDILGYSPFDCALSNRCLRIANKICKKYNVPRINVNIPLEYKESYLKCCRRLQYKPLFKRLVPYFAARELLLKRIPKTKDIQSYCGGGTFINLPKIYKVQGLTVLQLLQSKDGSIYSGYDQNFYSDLRFAIVFGNNANIKSLILNSSDINVQDIDKNTALHYAAIHGKLESVKLLISEGADITKQNCNKNTPFHLAAFEKQNDIVRFLISVGARADLINVDGETVLHSLLQTPWSFPELNSIMKLLISKGANVNAEDKNSSTVLHYATENNYDNLVKFLLANGAEIEKQDFIGDTPLLLALRWGHIKTAQLLLNSGANVNVCNKSGMTALHYVCKRTRFAPEFVISFVKLLISSGADINAETKNGYTALQYAIEHNDDDVVKFLLANGAEIEKQTCDGNTPLLLALSCGFIKTAKLLLNNGANVNVCNKSGMTALLYVCKRTRFAPEFVISFVKLLISSGADINAKNKNGYTALQYATKNNDDDLAEILLANGADIEKQNYDGNTPLLLALNCGHIKMAQLLLNNGANVNVCNKSGITALHYVCKTSGFAPEFIISFVKLLISSGADINAENKNGYTALQYATKNNDDDLVEILLANGADIEKQNYDGNTPLLLALSCGHIKTVQLLLNSGANVNVCNKSGITALHYVCKTSGYAPEFVISFVKLLISSSADINAENINGYTALHYATECNDDEVVKLLLANGAEIEKQTYEGNTSLLLALRWGHIKTAQLLLNNGANVKVCNKSGITALHYACQISSCSPEFVINFIKLLISSGEDINAEDENGYTGLHYATEHNDDDVVVKFLLANGAEIEKQTYEGNTSLLLALRWGNIKTTRLLVSNGANVNVCNKSGMTALHYVCRISWFSSESVINFVKLLILSGADINAEDINGYTGLHYATENNDDDLVKFLLANGAEIEKQSYDGNTPLLLALRCGHITKAQLLLNNGANVNVCNKSGITALHYACQISSFSPEFVINFVKLLISNGADINAEDKNGFTGLYCATKYNHHVLVKFLLANGADM